MDVTHPVNELIEQIVALERAGDALEDDLQRLNLARVSRQLRARLGPGVPKRRAASALGISPQALERWVRGGRVPAVRRPGSSRELIDTRALLALVREVDRLRGEGEERPVAGALAALAGDARLMRRLQPNQSARELRYEFRNSSPDERVRSLVALSQMLHELAARS